MTSPSVGARPCPPPPEGAIRTEIPTLVTERLILRAPGPEDFEPFAAFYASERASMVGGPESRRDAWRRLAAIVGHWHLRGYGFWTVTEGHAPLGLVGLWFPEGWHEPEIGWILFEGAEGRGIAREAAEAARAHAYGTLGWTTAVSVIHPGNARSIALADRMGARRDADFDHPKLGLLPVWRHPGPDALAGSAALAGHDAPAGHDALAAARSGPAA